MIMFLDFKTKLQEFTEMEMEINGVKERTAKGYAIKDTAVWWLFEKHSESMRQKGYSWEQYVEVRWYISVYT